MRDIKFRAWDGKRMTTSGIMFNCSTGSMDLPIGAQMKLMQFTGLKDKNGRDIYEGDIVTFERGVGNWTGKRMTTTHEVYFEDGICAFCLKYGSSYIKLRELENRYIYEIIGNTFQNPELLTQ